jgi:hypothetical protein
MSKSKRKRDNLRYRKKYFECYAAKEAVELGIAF